MLDFLLVVHVLCSAWHILRARWLASLVGIVANPFRHITRLRDLLTLLFGSIDFIFFLLIQMSHLFQQFNLELAAILTLHQDRFWSDHPYLRFFSSSSLRTLTFFLIFFILFRWIGIFIIRTLIDNPQIECNFFGFNVRFAFD